MTSGLFVSQKGERCGVYQFGRRVFGALSRGKSIVWQYLECDVADTALLLVKADKPDIVVLNHHPATMDWAASSRWKDDGAVVFSIFHEASQEAADRMEASFFDFLLCPDPTLLPRNPIIVPVPRVTTDYAMAEIESPGLFTVGSFGFATLGKGFDRLCATVNTECDQARIRLNIPPHDKEHMVPRERLDAILVSCRSAVTKPDIDLVITHDFLDDSGLMRFLAGNTVNAFLYEDQKACGISSCTDYAVASGRPLAISRSSMFRNLHKVNPSICIEDCSLQAIAGRGGKELAPLRATCSYDRAGAEWERAMLDAVDRLGISRSAPDGRGFNKILDDSSRQAYGAALRLQEKLAPEILSNKVARANIQQAFALDTALRLLPEEGFARILAIGSFEDTALAPLKAMGYLVDEIDPSVNGVDLDMFYRSPTAEMAGYDLILCVSVPEHVTDDQPFVRMAADLLAPNGIAVFTVDFAEGYVDGDNIPHPDQRFYTTREIGGRLLSALPDCALLDVPRWDQGVEDFEYEDCKYRFATWVFRKFGEEVLRRAHRDGNGTPAWKQLLAETALELTRTDWELARANLELAKASAELEVTRDANVVVPNLIYHLRFDGASRELQIGLKLARLLRKISWKMNPSRKRKWIAKTITMEAAAQNSCGATRALAPGHKPAITERRRLKRLCKRLRTPFRKVFRGFKVLLRKAPPARKSVVVPSSDSIIKRFSVAAPAGYRILYVFVQHTVCCDVNTGVQRVVRGLSRGLIDLHEKVRFVKWDATTKQCVLIDIAERSHLAQWNGPKVTSGDHAIYPPHVSLPIPVNPHQMGENSWLLVPEVASIASHSSPISLDLICWARRSGLKAGFVFYDAIPLVREEYANIAPIHAVYMRHLRLADVIWPISQYASDDLSAFWSNSEHATASTMPLTEVLHLPGEQDAAPRVEVPGPSNQLILCVGTIEPQKNPLLLIAAFKAFLERNPSAKWQLIFIGSVHPSISDDFHDSLDETILYEGNSTDKVLSEKYQECTFTVFPSIDEGFGLPILESIWYGRPCVCANFGAMAEVAKGGGCLTVDVRNETALSRAIEHLAVDAEFRRQLTADVLRRPVASWTDYATAIKQHVDDAGDPRSRLGTIYYWVDSTISFPSNTGIQRVTRQLARELLNAGLRVVPVKWDQTRAGFGPVGLEALEHFSLWNGPFVEQWSAWQEPHINVTGSWFFMAELPLNLLDHERKTLLRYAKDQGLSAAAVFYDAIPWKMRDIYPSEFATAHRNYMLGLAEYDLVFPISDFSKNDLVNFLSAELSKPGSLEDKIFTAVLPGEFTESKRLTDISHSKQDGVIKILCVGTIELRKNHENLLSAFILAVKNSRTRIELTLVGGRHSIEPALAERVRATVNNNPLIKWEEDADDARLKDLHVTCDFTIYPSVEEGFGLPIAESLWHGKPCICANFGAMMEVARGGGCLTIDMRKPEEIARAIKRLVADRELREKLCDEAVRRGLKSWRDYGQEVATRLAATSPSIRYSRQEASSAETTVRVSAMRIQPRPKLSVCVTTYNRAEWLAVILRNWDRYYPERLDDVEFLVCDNASSDNTVEVVKPYLRRRDFSYWRNPVNVGMLGNLRETVQHAQGQYVWILGDDDVIMPGAIERVLKIIDNNLGIPLIYLNYAFTRIHDARTVTDFNAFIQRSTPIVLAEDDRDGTVREICARNENFFTGIYTLVLRRDHAVSAYSQDTNGPPFSTMLTCIPTTHYVLHHMMDEPGIWIGSPQVVVNMNVSWMKYAPLWILERIPEVYELAERKGASSTEIDRWRRHTLPSIVHYFREIYKEDQKGNSAFFRPARLIRRFQHLSDFKHYRKELLAIYEAAWHDGHPAASQPPSLVFPNLSKANNIETY